jgi:protein-disulfide isomerase
MKKLLQDRRVLYGAVAAIAIVIAVPIVLVSVLGGSGGKKSASTTTSSTSTTPGTDKIPGAAEATAVFAGIPQKLNQLGNPKASVTMIEFADLQCPFCRDYAVDALPSVVKNYVRGGKIKLLFSGMHFVGPDSEKSLRAVYAAGLQGKLWQYLDLLYRNQGAENSGWVTDALLRRVGNSIPGFDTEKMMADMSSAKVDNAISIADNQASQAGVNSTPTFFAGPTGGTLQHLNVSALTAAAFKQFLDPLVT